MIPKPLSSSIDKADIDQLVENAVRESKTIEYKLELPAGNDDSKKEFLADISSFANAVGGDLIYGIREQRDENNRPTGIPEEAVGVEVANFDQLQLQLQTTIATGIEPRVPVRVDIVEGYNSRAVVVIRVPQTWNGPHMVTFKQRPCFYSRTGAGKTPLDITDIRAAFLASAELPDRIQRFRDARISKVLCGELPAQLEDSCCAILHVVPVSAFRDSKSINVDIPYNAQNNLVPFKGPAGLEARMNLDGFFIRTPARASGLTRASTQLFRTGAIEVVYSDLASRDKSSRLVNSVRFEAEIPAALERMLPFLLSLEFSPPFVIFVTLTGVRGRFLCWQEPYSEYADHAFDRDVIAIPDFVIDAVPFDSSSLRPVFDIIWQACGYPRDPSFDTDVLNKGRR